MAVHDVEVDPVGAGGDDIAHFLSELGVVGGENGRGDPDRQGHDVRLQVFSGAIALAVRGKQHCRQP